MAKGWIKLETVNDTSAVKETAAQKRAREHHFNNLIRNTKSLSAYDLKKQSEEAYEVAKAQEDSLIAAYNDKRLKSKDAIRRAWLAIKMREAAKKKNEVEKSDATDKDVVA